MSNDVNSDDRVNQPATSGVSAESREPERVTTHTTVIEKRGGGGGFIVGLILLLVLIVGGYFGFQALQNQELEASSVSDAADKVGEAADSVGDAADKAGEAIDGLTGE